MWEKDKVESRTEFVTCAWHGKQQYHAPKFEGDATCEKCATRPSVPAQGQADIASMCSQFYDRWERPGIPFYDFLQFARKLAASRSEATCANLDLSRPCSNAIYFGKCDDCDTRLKSVRSEAQPPSFPIVFLDRMGNRCEVRVADESQKETLIAWLEHFEESVRNFERKRAGAPAAGSGERGLIDAAKIMCASCRQYDDPESEDSGGWIMHINLPKKQTVESCEAAHIWREIFKRRTALAGTQAAPGGRMGNERT